MVEIASEEAEANSFAWRMPRPASGTSRRASGTGAGEPSRGLEQPRAAPQHWVAVLLPPAAVAGQAARHLPDAQPHRPVARQPGVHQESRGQPASSWASAMTTATPGKRSKAASSRVHTDIDDYYIFPGVLQLHAQVLLPDRPQDAPDYAPGRRADGL